MYKKKRSGISREGRGCALNIFENMHRICICTRLRHRSIFRISKYAFDTSLLTARDIHVFDRERVERATGAALQRVASARQSNVRCRSTCACRTTVGRAIKSMHRFLFLRVCLCFRQSPSVSLCVCMVP